MRVPGAGCRAPSRTCRVPSAGCQMPTPTKTTPSVKTLPDIFRTGKQWIQDCRCLNLDVDEIQDLVVSFYANKKVIQKTHKIKHVAADLLTNDFNMIVENDINNNISTGKIYFIEFFDYINLI